MARNITKRLDTLRARRYGTDRLNRVSAQDGRDILAKSLIEESYQKRTPNKPYTRYALGAMQEVSAEYTRVSLETAERVRKQLEEGLRASGSTVGFRLQGSVPCNVHIRGVSDVDMLTLDEAFRTYDRNGAISQRGGYGSPINYTPFDALVSLRAKTEAILQEKYPGAVVDVSGAKAVKISGGSLPRQVDVVPSHWHDTVDYQRSLQEEDRGVRILDKKTRLLIDNMPFRHIRLINDRDRLAQSGFKKAIRLCKNVKSDAVDDGTQIPLPSFDIAATLFHADVGNLARGLVYELAILAEAQRHLDALTTNEEHAKTLLVPDGSRRIFDTPEKLRGLRALSIEMDDLLRETAKEQSARIALLAAPDLPSSRAAVGTVHIPS